MPSRNKQLKFLFLLSSFFGILITIFGVEYFYYSSRILSFTSNPYKNEVHVRDANLYPNKVVIKSIGINLPIEEGTIVNGVWVVSPNKATHLINSAVPSENGNVVIYGHNTYAILGRLSVIKKNDQIEVSTKDGKSYTYKVFKVEWVKPTDVSVVEPTSYSILTVYTCTGFLDQYRLVVKASPLS